MSPLGKLVIAFLLLLAPLTARAATSPWQHDEAMTVRLISADETTGDGPELWFGLDIQMAEGWHTYWRNPGQAGLPPTLNWQASENLASAALLYPAPLRMAEGPLQTIGYKGRFVLPIRAHLQKPGETLHARLALDILACDEMCVPKHFDLALTLPAGARTPSAEAAAIEEARTRLPRSEEEGGIKITDIHLANEALTLRARSVDKLESPDLILETPKGELLVPTGISLGLDGHSVTFRVPLEGDMATATPTESALLTATLIDGEHAVEVKVKATPASSALLRLVGFALLALLGGFILNLMPCVLPVLSLKILGLIRHGGKSADEAHLVRHSFLATAGGVVFSFFLLALATIALKASGAAFGWGVQFQEPVFLVFLIALLTLFACNLFGFFEITLPRFLMDAIDPVHHPKLAGDFATGALATLLATPCTAPFLGTAVGFALAAGGFEIVVIFLALGTGMAAPYFLIALRPDLAARLPKPGAWMNGLTRFLGLGLAGTALWLLYVLSAEIGRHASLMIAGAMGLILLLLALRHLRGRKAFYPPLIALIIAGAMLTAHLAAAMPVTAGRIGWERFSEDTLARHLREGKIVYVDVTADWCLTCKVNKRLTLSKPEISTLLFRTAGIVALRADWTNPDPAITAFLRKHNRFGVPFNIVYGPRAPEGIILPELLFPGDVLDAIAQARGAKAACPVDLPPGLGC